MAKERTDCVLYDWQLDTAESILLGLDAVVVAGTGAGKTMLFMLLLLSNKKKMVIIISPLIALQEDMERRFWEFGISAKAVNGVTWNKEHGLDKVSSGKTVDKLRCLW